MLHKRVELVQPAHTRGLLAHTGLSSDTTLQFSRWRLRHKEKKRALKSGRLFIWIFY